MRLAETWDHLRIRRVLPFLLFMPLALLAGCSEKLVTTSISEKDCRREIDSQDPNLTPYLVCAGPAGTAVQIRSVEAGKMSVDLVLPNQRVVALSLQEHVSRHMFSLEDPLVWRLEQQDGRWHARALVMEIAERADSDDPALVTGRINALAKLDTDGACIVAVRPTTTGGGDAAWMADAATQPCTAALPE